MLNGPAVITKFLRLLMVYGMKEEVKAALKHILDVEWGFIDSSLMKKDFTLLFWYCYLFDLDADLIDLGAISLQWFDEKSNAFALYFYIHEEEFDQQIYKDKVAQFSRGTVLTDFEKELVLQKASGAVRSKLVNRPKAPIYY
jgi:hypothetical protein